MSEFELINQWFMGKGSKRPDVLTGVGDDCAITRVEPGCDLVVSSDTLVEGVHFPVDTAPEAIGHKLMAVNLSDVASMGAEPCWANLCLTLPRMDSDWLAGFARGLDGLATEHQVSLIGGDTTRGPLTLSLTIQGQVPHGQALMRSGARPGDRIYVTGNLGDAALALAVINGLVPMDPHTFDVVRERLDRPQPRVAAGRALRGLASSCVDVSDGLAADLGHVLDASCVGAIIHLDALPLSDVGAEYLASDPGRAMALSGGDDYELCFTVPEAAAFEAEEALTCLGLRCSWIGKVEAGSGLRCIDASGKRHDVAQAGYEHF
ncbi:MAG: thiamine-phosphate kinase [Gammaproteobacteria bacterium]